MTEPKEEKCEACCGSGYINFWTDDGHISMRTCRRCDGYGYIKVKPMTNEEYLRSCTTEQLAEFLNLIIRVGPYENEPKDFWEHVYGRGGEHGAKSIVTWLKKPHTEKE